MTDQELLTFLRENRERGAELLLEMYTPLLWTVCRRRLSDPEDIKECVNDVFLKICMNPDQYDPEQTSLKNYLAMIADRQAISRYRSIQRRNQAETTAAGRQTVNQEELHRELEEALALLQPEDALIIRMKYYGGMTYREIAGQMGITEEGAKKRGKRSLKKMAKWMIIGLIIAVLLAGCTYVVHHYVNYVRGIGVIESEKETFVYQMLDAPEPISINNATVQLLSVSYSDGVMAAIVVFHPETNLEQSYLYAMLGGDYEMFVNGIEVEFASHSDFMMEYVGDISPDNMEMNENGQIQLLVELIPWEHIDEQIKEEYGYDMDMSTLSWEITLQKSDTVQSLSDLGYCLETDYADYLVLTDWELSAETEDTYTFISLCPIRMTEGYSLSGLVSTCPSPLEGRTQEHITLVDGDGNSHSIYRMITPFADRGLTEFTMCFKNVPPGECTLHIPGLCYRLEGETVSITLPLPEKDGVTVEHDERLTLPDGSSVHFSGVRRETTSTSGKYMTEYWADGVQEWVPEEDTMTLWTYTFDEEVSTDESFPLLGLNCMEEFCYETKNGLSAIESRSGMQADKFGLDKIAFGIRDSFGMEAPDALSITFSGCYYLDPQDYSVPVTVK